MSRLVCLSLSLFAGPALAQVQPPVFPSNIDNYVVPWPDGVVSGSFLCIEPGDYNGDQVPDAAVLRGTKPVILLDPAILGASLVLPCNVNDIACLAHGGLNGEDVLATVDAGGLTLWDFVASLWNGGVTFSPRGVGTVAWAGALQVVHGDLDGDLDEDLLGLGADGRTILFRTNQGAGSFASLPSFQALFPVRQLGLVEWDGDPAPEVWALTTKALEVYELSGARVANNRNFSLTAQVDGVAVLRHPQPDFPTTDQIVWATRVSPTSPNQVLLVLYQGGYEPNPIVLTNSAVVALATGDYDHDGDADLLMSDKNLHVVRRVDNQKAPPPPPPPYPPPPPRTFEGYPAGTVDYWAGTSGQNAPPNLCTLPWMDWDNDAELDLICAAEPQSWVLLYPGVDPQGPEVEPDPDGVQVVAGHPAFASMHYFAASETPCPGSRQYVGLLDISLDNAWNLPANDINDTNVIDLIVYRQAVPSDEWPVSDAIRHHRYGLESAVDPANSDKFLVHVLIPEPWVNGGPSGATFNRLYFCQLRVILNPGPSQQVLRTYVGGFTSDVAPYNPDESWQALMQLPSSWPGSIPRIFNYCPPPETEPGSVNAAGFRPLSRMPPFEPGQSPYPGPVTLWSDFYNP